MTTTSPPRAWRAPAALLLAAGLAASLPGCGGDTPTGRRPVSEVREADAAERVAPPEMETAQRLGLRSVSAAPDTAPAAAQPEVPAPTGLPELAWDNPEGWTPQPATAMRVANFTLADSPESECYLTVLPGTAGGMLANLNRWRQQMSLEPMDEDDLGLLPRIPMLGGEAVRIAVDGTFVGMRADQQRPGYRMIGAALVSDGHSYFVRLTGPVDALAGQDAAFDAFCASLRFEGGGSAPAVAAAPPAPPAAPEAAPAPAPRVDLTQLQWDAPAHWTRGPERMMRLVTYTIGGSECYVTQLAGDGGGIEMNLNRWRGQVGQPDLDAAAIAALPRVTILGVESPLLDVTGNLTNMDGSTIENARVLGTVTLLDRQSLFVKMTGPDAEVAAERDHFVAFCQSLR